MKGFCTLINVKFLYQYMSHMKINSTCIYVRFICFSGAYAEQDLALRSSHTKAATSPSFASLFPPPAMSNSKDSFLLLPPPESPNKKGPTTTATTSHRQIDASNQPPPPAYQASSLPGLEASCSSGGSKSRKKSSGSLSLEREEAGDCSKAADTSKDI